MGFQKPLKVYRNNLSLTAQLKLGGWSQTLKLGDSGQTEN